MGIKLVKFLGGTYPVSESVKILLDELNKAGIDDAAREELFLNRFSMSERMPSLYEALENDPDFKFEDIKRYSLQMSKKILTRLDQAPDKKSVLTQAYVFCPFLLEVYQASVRYGLLDWDTYKTAEYFGYAESVLEEILSFVSAHPEDKELTAGLVSVYAKAKGLPEEKVWASFGESSKEEQQEVKSDVSKKVRRRAEAEAKKRANEKVKEESPAEEIKKEPEASLKSKEGKKGLILLVGLVIVCLLLLLWKINRAPAEEEPVDMASNPSVEEVIEEQPVSQTDADRQLAEERVASLHDSILTDIGDENVYEYNDETQMFGFEKTVKNTTGLVLENVVLKVTLGTDVNTYTKEVWNPDEEWTLIVNASEDTLVNDDFSIGAELTQYTYQTFTKSE